MELVYSAAVWEELGQAMTAAFNIHSRDEIQQSNSLSLLEIIYNKIQSPIKHLAKDNTIQIITVHLVQEIKIVYVRMNIPANQQLRNMIRIHAHLLTTTRKTISLQ